MNNRKQPVHLVTALQKRLRVGKAVCPKVFHLLNGHSVIEERIFQTGATPHGADDSIVDAPPGIRFKRRPFARLIGMADCERQLLSDCAVVPLFSQQKRLLIASGIQGLVFDPFGPVLDLTETTLKK